MHPNRTLLIVKRKARTSGSVGAGQAHAGLVDNFVHQNAPSPESAMPQKTPSPINGSVISSEKEATCRPKNPRRPLIGPKKTKINLEISEDDVPSPQPGDVDSSWPSSDEEVCTKTSGLGIERIKFMANIFLSNCRKRESLLPPASVGWGKVIASFCLSVNTRGGGVPWPR